MLALSGAGTTSPLGEVTGATYVSPDNTFFFAYLVPVSQPAQREFIYGGQPVNGSFYTAKSTSPSVLAFAILPNSALPSVIPFLGTQTRGTARQRKRFEHFAIVSRDPGEQHVFNLHGIDQGAAGESGDHRDRGRSELGPGCAGRQRLQRVAQRQEPAAADHQRDYHGSVLTNAMGQPTRIFLPYVTPADGNGNSFYGANASQASY